MSNSPLISVRRYSSRSYRGDCGLHGQSVLTQTELGPKQAHQKRDPTLYCYLKNMKSSFQTNGVCAEAYIKSELLLSGLCPSSGILKTEEPNVSETGSVSGLRWRGGRYLLCWPWLRSVLSMGPNRVRVSYTATWGRKQIQFPKRCDL
jgi:hypothetical protein